MPIRINLLAEEQALEEMKRRDPVKRAAVYSGMVAVVVLVVWGGLLMQGLAKKGTLSGREKELKDISPKAKDVSIQKQAINEMGAKLVALNKLAANRFIWGSQLDALQRCLATNSPVQIVAIRGTQNYILKPSEQIIKDGKKIPSAATTKELAAVILEARDNGNPVDQNYNQLRDAIVANQYFKDHLKPNGVALKDITAPQPDSTDPSKMYIRFVLELQYPEVIRQ